MSSLRAEKRGSAGVSRWFRSILRLFEACNGGGKVIRIAEEDDVWRRQSTGSGSRANMQQVICAKAVAKLSRAAEGIRGHQRATRKTRQHKRHTNLDAHFSARFSRQRAFRPGLGLSEDRNAGLGQGRCARREETRPEGARGAGRAGGSGDRGEGVTLEASACGGPGR